MRICLRPDVSEITYEEEGVYHSIHVDTFRLLNKLSQHTLIREQENTEPSIAIEVTPYMRLFRYGEGLTSVVYETPELSVHEDDERLQIPRHLLFWREGLIMAFAIKEPFLSLEQELYFSPIPSLQKGSVIKSINHQDLAGWFLDLVMNTQLDDILVKDPRYLQLAHASAATIWEDHF